MNIELDRPLNKLELYRERFLTKTAELLFGITHSGPYLEHRLEVAHNFINCAKQEIQILSKDDFFYTDPLLNTLNNLVSKREVKVTILVGPHTQGARTLLRQALNPEITIGELPNLPQNNFIIIDGRSIHLEVPGNNFDVAVHEIPEAAQKLGDKFKMYLQTARLIPATVY